MQATHKPHLNGARNLPTRFFARASLVSILLVFARMEREATAERTCEAVSPIRKLGYHHGKAPYGFKAVPAPDQPRFKVVVEDPEEQKILLYIKEWLDAGLKVPDIAARLDSGGIKPPQTDRWRTSFPPDTEALPRAPNRKDVARARERIAR